MLGNGLDKQAGRAENTVNAVWRLLVRLTIIGVTLFTLYHLRGIIVTLLVGAIIAYIFEPMVDGLIHQNWFVRFHALRRSASGERMRPSHHSLRLIATIYMFFVGLFALGIGTNLIIKPFSDQIREFGLHKKEYSAQYERTVPKEWRDRIDDKINDEDFQSQIQQALLPVAARGVAALSSIVEIVLLPVLAFYFILDGKVLKREFIALVPRRYLGETVRMIREFNSIMRAYVLGQFILCLLAGVVVGLGLMILGVKYAFVLGILAGLTRAVPIVGPILGGIPIILLTWVSSGEQGFHKALAVLTFFTFLHFAESKVIMPKLIGDRVELHPIVIIVVLLVGGEMGGLLLGGSLGALLGMFFAAPVAAIIRVMIRRYRLKINTRPSHHAASLVLTQTISTRTISITETAE